MSLFVPWLFLMFAGGSYAVWFRKRLEEAVFPSLCICILFLLLSGMICGSLTIGIILSLVLSLVGWLGSCYRDRSEGIHSFFIQVSGIYGKSCGGILVLLLFLFLYLINTGKYFNRWDEFSHWGIFIKECLRTDGLYCASPYKFNHQDYVPAATLFEFLWARLSFRYAEADAFRAIQFLQLSAFLPLVTLHTDQVENRRRRFFTVFIRLLIVLGIPLLFDKLNFYHSIYTDGAVATFLFSCMWIAHNEKSGRYKIFSLTVVLCVLLQTKMLAVILLPMVVIYAAVTDAVIYKAGKMTILFGIFAETAVPLGLWTLYNRYVRHYLGYSANGAGGQSYAGHGVSSILKVLAHDGSIPYQGTVERLYLKALFTNGIFWKVSFLLGVAGVILFLLLFAEKSGKVSDHSSVTGTRLLALWCFVASVVYSMVMLYLYLTSFSEVEAVGLTGFERYMASLLMTVIYFVPAVLFSADGRENDVKGEDGNGRMVALALAALSLWGLACMVRQGGQVRQMLPGRINGEEQTFAAEAGFLKDHVPDEDNVLMISRGDRGYYGTVLRYACWPIETIAVSPGPPAFEGDVWSTEWTHDQMMEQLRSWDHLWIYHADEAFWEMYSSILADKVVPVDGGLYRVQEGTDGFVFTPEGVYTVD